MSRLSTDSDMATLASRGHLPGVATPGGGYPVDVQLMWPGRPVRSSVILKEAHLLLSYHIELPFK